MSELVRVASIDEVPAGSGKEIMAGDRVIALFHVGDAFYALDGICPHAGGPLGQGAIEDQIVTCPWHGWQFDVTTGKHCLNDKLTHPCYPVIVKDREIYLDIG